MLNILFSQWQEETLAMLEEEYTPLNYFLLGKASPPPSAGGITPLYMLNMLFSQWQEETLAMLEEEYIPLKYFF